ncbi:MAG: hypothetical protein K2L13_03735 [Opitutales bacterium]|nr:hypothetical protein [Opitutales bacterium]
MNTVTTKPKVEATISAEPLTSVSIKDNLKQPEIAIQDKTQIIPPFLIQRHRLREKFLTEHQAKANPDLNIAKKSISPDSECLSPAKQYQSQRSFIYEELHKENRERGGDGDCLIYSIIYQLPQYQQMGITDSNKFKYMVEFRHNTANFAKQRFDTYKADVEKKLKDAVNQQVSSQSEKEEREKKISKYTALLRDIPKEERAIKDLDTVHQDLDVCGEEGKWISMYLNRKIAVFSEYNPGSKESTIGSFFLRLPNGDAEMHHYTDSDHICDLLKDAIWVYHTGNDKGGHYQEIS